MTDAVATIARHARAHRLAVMTAESCTGGLLAAALTEAAGASVWFHGGIVAYHNDTKTALLEVPADTLAQHGAVSEESAAAMCDGLRRAGAGAGAAITGIAGPGGGSADKPVGTVCIAAFAAQRQHVETQRFSGDRAAVRAAAVSAALAALARALEQRAA